jgi:hypothetical protein
MPSLNATSGRDEAASEQTAGLLGYDNKSSEKDSVKGNDLEKTECCFLLR